MDILGSFVVLRIGLGITVFFGGVEEFGGRKHFGFYFDSGFVVAERFDSGYFRDDVIFGNNFLGGDGVWYDAETF